MYVDKSDKKGILNVRKFIHETNYALSGILSTYESLFILMEAFTKDNNHDILSIHFKYSSNTPSNIVFF